MQRKSTVKQYFKSFRIPITKLQEAISVGNNVEEDFPYIFWGNVGTLENNMQILNAFFQIRIK